MGWFWADAAPTPSSSALPANHPPNSADAKPPLGCPMHQSSTPTPPPSITASSCPVVHSSFSDAEPPHASTSTSTLSKLNPLNWMPSDLSQDRARGQTLDLPLERERSSIPRGDGEGNWEYPSPQQMYNAMLRKGYTDTPQDAVESMVAVHNFLNEGAWAEIVEWERRFGKGLVQGWQESRRGEEGSIVSAAMGVNWQDSGIPEPRLVRFMGRPGELTPKAKMLQVMGWLYPAKFESEPPFDRHDWFVQRHLPNGEKKEVRYVIDYYSGPPEPTGEPVFYLDVRPAIDSPTAAAERLVRWGRDVWWRAVGGDIGKKT